MSNFHKCFSMFFDQKNVQSNPNKQFLVSSDKGGFLRNFLWNRRHKPKRKGTRTLQKKHRNGNQILETKVNNKIRIIRNNL